MSNMFTSLSFDTKKHELRVMLESHVLPIKFSHTFALRRCAQKCFQQRFIRTSKQFYIFHQTFFSKMTLWCWFINLKIIIQLTIKMSMLNCSMQLAGEREAEIAAKVQIIVIANNFSMQFMSKINYIKICLLTFLLKYCETRHRACIHFSTIDYCIKVF